MSEVNDLNSEWALVLVITEFVLANDFLFDKNALGPQIPMYEPLIRCGIKSLENLPHDEGSFIFSELILAGIVEYPLKNRNSLVRLRKYEYLVLR